jgi:hypothetical protein
MNQPSSSSAASRPRPLTDKQLDKLYLKIDRRITRINEEMYALGLELGEATYEIAELRRSRDEYRDRWLRS